MDIEVAVSSSDMEQQLDPLEARKRAIQRNIQYLAYASQCRDDNCSRPNCFKMKRVIQHSRICRRKAQGKDCPICRQFIALCCFHAKQCQDNRCQMPYCNSLKLQLREYLVCVRRRLG